MIQNPSHHLLGSGDGNRNRSPRKTLANLPQRRSQVMDQSRSAGSEVKRPIIGKRIVGKLMFNLPNMGKHHAGMLRQPKSRGSRSQMLSGPGKQVRPKFRGQTMQL